MRDTAEVHGYESTSYGDGFAEIYDDWYADVTDVGATVQRMVAVAGSGGHVLELGVGTGRLAVPMVEAGSERHRHRRKYRHARPAHAPRPIGPRHSNRWRHG